MNCDVFLSRGVTSINNMLKLTKGMKIRKKILLLKGKNYEKEIIEARKNWLFNVNYHDSVTSKEGKIIEILSIKN